MASVFLSYDRDDATKARSIARALEKAGHSVWWDRHIKGGAQYSKEIEEALKRADAVIVLWSERSVDSAWVRDEAAAGRDSGRLVPARLDATEPPLGFRQYQTSDLAKWNGRGRSAAFQGMIEAIEALGERREDTPAAIARGPRSLRLPLPVIFAAIFVILMVTGLILLRPWERQPLEPVVAVEPANQSGESNMLADSLLAQLGHLQSGDASALQLVDDGFRGTPDLLFKVGAQADGASLALLSGKGGALLWSRDFRNDGGNQADLRQQMAHTAGLVLQCASEALSAEGGTLKRPMVKLYLNGCAGLSFNQGADPRTLIPGLRKVTEEAPRFQGGWAKLLLAELGAFKQTGFADDALRRDLRSHIELARKLNPTMAELHMTEAWLQTPRPIIGWMRFAEKAVELNPHHARALEERVVGYFHVGRLQDALTDAKQAALVNPLSPSARDTLIVAHANAGQFEAAGNALANAERLWPGASNLVAARFLLLYRYGEPREALRMLKSGALSSRADSVQESFLKARIDPTPSNTERAIADARSQFERDPGALSNYSQTLAEFGRHDELYRIFLTADTGLFPGVIAVLFRPQFNRMHEDPRFMAVTDRLGLIDYWRESGTWPDFCQRADLPYDCEAEAAKLAA